MYLKSLELINFKNHQKSSLQFSSEINCIVGLNGSGKTTILDSIYYLSLTKSAIQSSDTLNILHDKPFFTIKGKYAIKEKDLDIRCTMERGKKKTIFQDEDPVAKNSEHVGLIPLVLIAPDDTDLIRGVSEGRRKFFDGLISQLDRNYLKQLIRYHNFLKQRNALLKRFAETGKPDYTLLGSYDVELISLSESLATRRKALLDKLAPALQQYYEELASGQEKIQIEYETKALDSDFTDYFYSKRDRDLIVKTTAAGIHKDDFHFLIDGHPLKKVGSQGQQKSFIIALKLAQFAIFEKEKGEKPLLLLDDIFDKLDDKRIEQMMLLISKHTFGQIFLTDARPERSREILGELDSEVKFYEVVEGEITL